MGEVENCQTAERVFEAIRERDVALFHEQFREDSIIEFPQSGERIVGGENRRAVYREFPGHPTVRRIVVGGDLVVVETTIDYGDETEWSGVFIYELRDGKIAWSTCYWAAPFEPAESRAPWVEHMGD